MPAQLRLVAPSIENRSVLVRPPNSELRSREYLTPAEVEKLIKVAEDGRWGHRRVRSRWTLASDVVEASRRELRGICLA
jgi:hypothetical protein